MQTHLIWSKLLSSDWLGMQQYTASNNVSYFNSFLVEIKNVSHDITPIVISYHTSDNTIQCVSQCVSGLISLINVTIP